MDAQNTKIDSQIDLKIKECARNLVFPKNFSKSERDFINFFLFYQAYHFDMK